MRKLTIEEVGKMYYNSSYNINTPIKKLSGPDDWGDPTSVGVHLKRGKDFYSLEFGRFLGQYDTDYLVGIKDIEGRIVSGELFESEEEMKASWNID